MKLGALFRRIHKWVGLILGVQLLIWALSGAMMATLDHHSVAGGDEAPAELPRALPINNQAWPVIQSALGSTPATGISVQALLDRQAVIVTTQAGTRIFDAATGAPVTIDAGLIVRIASAAHPGQPVVRSVAPMSRVTFAVREHQLPIWQVDFADPANSSYFISGTTGAILERRNDRWRLWDFFWMLHTMDYAKRSSFNHPLIVVAAIGAVWLTLSGLYLIFKTNWSPEKRWWRRRRRSSWPRAI